MNNRLPDGVAPFFWLHIKKSAGGTVRRVLAPEYAGAQRGREPVNFIQSPRSQHNDILNNFRMPLGPYQFRRADFAKSWLYKDCWDQLFRFAFVRDPLARCVSAFHYLSHPRGGERSFVQHLQETQDLPTTVDTADLFDVFLDLVAQAQTSKSIYKPVNLHFTTHTAAMWGDITDPSGQVLLSHVFRLEDLHLALAEVFRLCDMPRHIPAVFPRTNANLDQTKYNPSPEQRHRVETLYSEDFDLYESAHIHRFN